MKRIICILIAITLCGSLIIQTSAESQLLSNDLQFQNDIIRELSYFETNKSAIGLEGIDFNHLRIGRKIRVYEYLSTGFCELSEAYLIFEENNVVTLAYNIGNSQYQFMTSLAKMIEETAENKFAIVYDRFGCYLYNGALFTEIYYTTALSVNTRGILSDVTQVQKMVLQLSDAFETIPLLYTAVSTRPQNYICAVSYVTQNPYANICWAATIAMISNYVNGTSLSAVDVASGYYGVNFNYTLNASATVSLMNNVYNLSYTHNYTVPSDTAILWNIQNGYPIFAIFSQSGSGIGHTGALYGINPIAARLMIIDPTFGSTTCFMNGSGNYYYIHSGTGATFVLNSAICRGW